MFVPILYNIKTCSTEFSLNCSYPSELCLILLCVGDSLLASKTFRDLNSNGKFIGGEENIRYLTAEDLYKLSLEVTENSLSDKSSETEYVPSKESFSVAEQLFNRLSRYSL